MPTYTNSSQSLRAPQMTKVTRVAKKMAMTDFDEEEPVGPKVQQNLANIAEKTSGTALANDKLKAILAKNAKSEDCAGMTVRKATLRFGPS